MKQIKHSETDKINELYKIDQYLLLPSHFVHD